MEIKKIILIILSVLIYPFNRLKGFNFIERFN